MIAHTPARLGIVATATAAVLGLAAPAFAHVTVHPAQAVPGSYAKLTFRVPNEQEHAETSKLQITLPKKTPIPSVSVKPHPGWSFQVQKTTLPNPIQTDDGPIRQVVSQITWTATTPDAAIQPGQFDEFAISAGPLPENATALRFPTVQTYSNGDTVRWIQTAAPGAPEPDHPAPQVSIHRTTTNTAATTRHNSSDPGDTTALTLSIAALVIALAAAASTGYTLTRRRSRADGSTGSRR